MILNKEADKTLSHSHLVVFLSNRNIVQALHDLSKSVRNLWRKFHPDVWKILLI